jgi:hypothetical protein
MFEDVERVGLDVLEHDEEFGVMLLVESYGGDEREAQDHASAHANGDTMRLASDWQIGETSLLSRWIDSPPDLREVFPDGSDDACYVVELKAVIRATSVERAERKLQVLADRLAAAGVFVIRHTLA